MPELAKAFRHGTHRAVSPAETVARAKALTGPLGITRIANVTGLDFIGIPVVIVCRPNARSLAVSQGKGIDLDAARASGLMESVELYHAERITSVLKFASWNDLRFKERLVDLNGLPLLSVSTFQPDRLLLWISGVDLFGPTEVWLPFELVHTNYTLPLPPGSGCFIMSSNGLASGNHPLEAIVHGLCEVIERDATTLFRFASETAQASRRVDLETIQDSACRAILDLLDRAKVSVGIWDVTSDVRIPAFRAIILDREPNPFRPLGPLEGMGCHPVREIAFLRALTEAAQGRLTLIAGSRDDNPRSLYGEAQDADLISRARARLTNEQGIRAFEETPSISNASFEHDVASILSALTGAGLHQAIVVDLSKPEFGIPVARVVVPGLEPYHRVQGYVPGARARRVLSGLGGKDFLP